MATLRCVLLLQLMRRSSDPEVRRNAAAATTIESLDETAARDAVSEQDGVQQIVASPANSQVARSMQSSTTSIVGGGDDSNKEALELTPLKGGAQPSIKTSDSMVSLPNNRVRILI